MGFNNEALEKFQNETRIGGFADIWEKQNVAT